MTSADTLARFLTLHPKLIDLSLGRIERLLATLGHPEQQLPPVIHVAGTNGKGSVGAFLRFMLQARGKKIQAYTSPHLVRFHERIRLSTGLIGEEKLADVLRRVEVANEGQPITYFEATTTAAFEAFAHDKADYCILEVGLGGLYDATNVVADPLACIIAPVAIDHEGFLGSEIVGIATEKAGIIKQGAPVFSAAQSPEAKEVIGACAAEMGARVYTAGHDWTVAPTGTQASNSAVYEDPQGQVNFKLLRMAGWHQVENAGLALACLRYGGAAGTLDEISTGLAKTTWPARLQLIDRGALAKLRHSKGTLLLDGGHNPHAATAIAETFSGQKLHVVVGMMENKDIAAFLGPLLPIISRLCAVPIAGETCHPPAEIVQVAEGLRIPATAHQSVGDALTALPDGNVLVLGSLYLAGIVLGQSGLEPD